MRDIIIFAALASLAGTVFLVSLVELIFTIRRRKVKEQINSKIKELKATYNQSVNQMVKEEEQKLQEADTQIQAARTALEQEKEQITEEYQSQMEKLKKETEHELERAKAHAKKMEQEAKMKAEEYLDSRKEEVEQDLMNLVMSVTKKVLPESLSYDVQKELVMQALHDAKTGSKKDNA